MANDGLRWSYQGHWPVLSYTDSDTVTASAPNGQNATQMLRLPDNVGRLFEGPLTCDISNALDLDGSTANAASTWYFIYLVPKKGDSTKLDLIGSTNSPSTGPTGYDTFQYLGPIRNNGSSTLLDFTQHGQWIYYRPLQFIWNDNSPAYSTYTDVDCSAFVPPTSELFRANIELAITPAATETAVVSLRPKGYVTGRTNFFTYRTQAGTNSGGAFEMSVETGSDQIFEYELVATTFTTVHWFGVQCIAYHDPWIPL